MRHARTNFWDSGRMPDNSAQRSAGTASVHPRHQFYLCLSESAALDGNQGYPKYHIPVLQPHWGGNSIGVVLYNCQQKVASHRACLILPICYLHHRYPEASHPAV